MRADTIKISYLGLILCLISSLMIGSPSYAVVADRPLPKDGLLGKFKPSAIPTLVIDNKVVKLSAGAQIRDQKNRIVQIAGIRGPDTNVLYEKNQQGQIERMWMLTDEEYKRIKAGAKPVPLRQIKNSSMQIH